MASVYSFPNAMSDWNLKQNPLAPTAGVLGAMTQDDSGAMPEVKESAEARVPQMPTAQPQQQAPQATVTPFGGKSPDVYKSGFDAAEERKNAWDLVKEDPQTTLIAFAMSMMANNDGTRNVTQLVGQAGLDALTAVQAREKARYERGLAADKIGYERFKDKQANDLNVRKQDWTEQFQNDQMKRGWEDLRIKDAESGLKQRKLQKELDDAAAIDRIIYGGSVAPSGGRPTSASTPFVARQDENSAWVLPGSRTADEIKSLLSTGTVKGLSPEVEGMIREAAAEYGVDPNLMMAVAMQESGGSHIGKDGKVVTSPKNAVGIMQVIPNDAHEYGFKPEDAYDLRGNIRYGAAELARKLKESGGDINEALLRYNWGSGNVNAYKKTGKGYYKQAIPQEAYEYADKVFGRATPAQSAAGIPVVNGNGIQPTDTTGAPRIGQQSAIPGFRMYSPQEQAVLARTDAGRSILKYNSPSEMLKAGSEMRKAAAEERKLDPGFQLDQAHRGNINTQQMKDLETYQKYSSQLPRLMQMERLFENGFKTGYGQEFFDQAGIIAKTFGASDDFIKSLGANNPQAVAEYRNLVMRNVFDELALQKGVQTEGDAQRAQALWMALGNTTEGNRILNQIAIASVKRNMEMQQRSMDAWMESGGDPSKYNKLMKEWHDKQDSLFVGKNAMFGNVYAKYFRQDENGKDVPVSNGEKKVDTEQVTLPDGRKLTMGRASR